MGHRGAGRTGKTWITQTCGVRHLISILTSHLLAARLVTRASTCLVLISMSRPMPMLHRLSEVGRGFEHRITEIKVHSPSLPQTSIPPKHSTPLCFPPSLLPNPPFSPNRCSTSATW